VSCSHCCRSANGICWRSSSCLSASHNARRTYTRTSEIIAIFTKYIAENVFYKQHIFIHILNTAVISLSCTFHLINTLIQNLHVKTFYTSDNISYLQVNYSLCKWHLNENRTNSVWPNQVLPTAIISIGCLQTQLSKFPVDFQDCRRNFRQIPGDFHGHLSNTEHSLSLQRVNICRLDWFELRRKWIS